MNDRIAKQAYDKGYDAGLADMAKGAATTSAPNPYKVSHPHNTSSRYELWAQGYLEAWRGWERRKSQAEAEQERLNHWASLEAFRARVLQAFAAHRLYCDCVGVVHEAACPLGELEIEADLIRKARIEA